MLTVSSSCRSRRRCATHCCAQPAPVLTIPGSPRQPAAPSLGSPTAPPAGSALLGKGIKRKAGFVQFICSYGEWLTRQRKPGEPCQPGRPALQRPSGNSRAGWQGNKTEWFATVLKAFISIKQGAQPQKAPPANAAQSCCSLEHSCSALANDGGRKQGLKVGFSLLSAQHTGSFTCLSW